MSKITEHFKKFRTIFELEQCYKMLDKATTSTYLSEEDKCSIYILSRQLHKIYTKYEGVEYVKTNEK